jgi:alkanesulfonate monooxygenase SsuD/methylene tetrahydromethanopterin reductase-like flavin-dependent oxidoreductase (luciferase family)
MQVGIGLPNAVREVPGRHIIDFAREADQAGFSTLGTIDRIAYSNYEALVTLGAAAAVTERIKLMTSVLLAPLRTNTALFAKQAASVDGLSGGRLMLGLGVGAREDDYTTSGVDFHARGKFFDAQLEQLRRFWDGDEVGPAPAEQGGPTLILGGSVDRSFKRAAKYGAGWIAGGAPPEVFKEAVPKLEAAWQEAGRDGEPRKLALGYYSLGPDAEKNAYEKLAHYYAHLGEGAKQLAAGTPKTPDEVKARVAAFADAGADELILFPATSEPEQVEFLREALDGADDLGQFHPERADFLQEEARDR